MSDIWAGMERKEGDFEIEVGKRYYYRESERVYALVMAVYAPDLYLVSLGPQIVIGIQGEGCESDPLPVTTTARVFMGLYEPRPAALAEAA